ncbi:MAG: stage II sporulation protein M [Candidatus Bathyarchaeota archaeon]|nr:MAG: stage II sporulation protein M [Candidatus Bathyarchaeota archaeon]
MTGAESRHRPAGFLGFLFGRQVDYVRRLKPLFTLCLFGFIFSLLVGYNLGGSIQSSVMEELLGGIPDLEGFNVTMIFLFIVYNNVFRSFLWMLLGIVGSFPPLFFTVLFGFFLGHFSYSVSLEQGLGFTVMALIPHGVIEIPTILLSSAAGMALGYALINRLRGRGSLRVEFGRALVLYITRIVPLLILSAVIEVTLTPLLVISLGLI